MDELELRVPGMTCHHCVRAVSTEVGDVPGVTGVAVDLATKTIRVSGDADVGAIRAAIAEAGYEARP